MNTDDMNLLNNTRHLLEVFAADIGSSRVSAERLAGLRLDIAANLETLACRYSERANGSSLPCGPAILGKAGGCKDEVGYLCDYCAAQEAA